MSQLINPNNPEQWLLIADLNVQHEFIGGFNCEEFLNFLLDVTADIDSVKVLDVNQACYGRMQKHNLVDFIDGSPTFLGRVLNTTAELPKSGVGTPVITSDVEFREQQAQNLTDTVVKQVSFEVRRHVEAEVKKLLKL